MVNPPDSKNTSNLAQETKTWGMVCHLSALFGCICPFGNVIGPLVVWLLKKDEIPVVNEYGKESLNFQISMTIYMLAIGIIATILSVIVIGAVLFPLIGIVAIVDLILVIIATVDASKGKAYHYPLSFRLVT